MKNPPQMPPSRGLFKRGVLGTGLKVKPGSMLSDRFLDEKMPFVWSMLGLVQVFRKVESRKSIVRVHR